MICNPLGPMCAEFLAALTIADKGVNCVEERADVIGRNAHPSVGITHALENREALVLAASARARDFTLEASGSALRNAYMRTVETA